MAAMSDADQETPLLWQWVNLTDYRPPTASVKAISENWWATLRKRIGRDEAEAEAPDRINRLEALSHEQLARIIPDPDWRDAAIALDGALEGGLTDEPSDRPMVFLIGPPHSGCADILRRWAEHRQWRVLDPPTPEQILTGDPTWLSSQMTGEQPWVLPALERVYLRHAAGLGLMRQFLHQAYSSSLGCGIIGCDSWAWAFLRRVWPNRRSRTLTLQAFDQERLSLYLQRLAEVPERPPLLFRQASGKYVLPPPAENSEETTVVDRDFLGRLAAYSRGIPGIAWTLWRVSLRNRPDAQMTPGEPCAEDLKPPHRTIWVAPWNDIKKPTLPAYAGRDQAFVLHALLLHNGLTAEWLEQLLPLSPDQVMEALWLLQDAGLLERAGEVWRVSPVGYPIVRKFLEDQRYFIDDF
jgi:hypothetical protein